MERGWTTISMRRAGAGRPPITPREPENTPCGRYTRPMPTSRTLGPLALCCAAAFANAQTTEPSPAPRATHVFHVMIDGLRWQEVFTGADERYMTKDVGKVEKPEPLVAKWVRPTARELRVVDLATPEHVPWPPVRSNGRGCDRSSAAVVTVVSLIAGELWTEELTLAIGSVDTPDGEVSIVAPGLSLRAPSAELAGWRPLLDPIRASFSVNPSWLAGRR